MATTSAIFKPKVIGGFAQRGRRPPRKRRRRVKPLLTINQILAWADEHRERTGKWPNVRSGRVHGDLAKTWAAVNFALYYGLCGLLGGSSLAKLLAERRGKRNPAALPVLTIKQILQWADGHRMRTGKWPTRTAGKVNEDPTESWKAIDESLRGGFRGLPGGSSLTRVLVKYRGIRNQTALPRLTIRQVLAWADAHHRRTGRWPKITSGEVKRASGQTWASINSALKQGGRGLPSGSSLARLLDQHRHVRNRSDIPDLTVAQILEWADTHYRRTGAWPMTTSGPVHGARGERWGAINTSLHTGGRGLPGGSSLAILLARYRRVPKRACLPPLTERLILKWVDEHHRRTGKWPSLTNPLAAVRALPGIRLARL